MTKPITEEQVEELEKNYFSLIKWCFNHQECLNNYGCGWYERFWDTEFKPMFTKILSQARNKALKEVLELDRLKEMPIYIGHIFDGEQLENKRYIGRKAEEKFKAELRASIKELMGKND